MNFKVCATAFCIVKSLNFRITSLELLHLHFKKEQLFLGLFIDAKKCYTHVSNSLCSRRGGKKWHIN